MSNQERPSDERLLGQMTTFTTRAVPVVESAMWERMGDWDQEVLMQRAAQIASVLAMLITSDMSYLLLIGDEAHRVQAITNLANAHEAASMVHDCAERMEELSHILVERN